VILDFMRRKVTGFRVVERWFCRLERAAVTPVRGVSGENPANFFGKFFIHAANGAGIHGFLLDCVQPAAAFAETACCQAEL
jgi:hypothetical protein